MTEIIVSDRFERSPFITYLYNGIAGPLSRLGGREELLLGEERAALRISVPKEEEAFRSYLCEKLAEIIGIGYKSLFLADALDVCLPKREKHILAAALIAADLEGDCSYIRRKLEGVGEYSIDGFYEFRLLSLKEKWKKIVDYIPRGFSPDDLKRFCEFLVGESRRKIYVKGRAVYGENFVPLRKSRLMGEENVETEIMLSDAGFVYCLGDVEEPLEEFLRKYYAERAVFS